VSVYLGGDFNVLPMNRGTGRAVRAYVYQATPPAAGTAGNPCGASTNGTTYSGAAGQPIDYWYSHIDPNAPLPPAAPLIVPIPLADARTCDNDLMSDHCGIFLRIT
jgi:hypothetical protein